MALDKKITEQINRIVFDALARRGSVYIDGIGSLRPASGVTNVDINGRKTAFPVYNITFEKGATTGADLKSQMLSIDGIDKNNLASVFYDWLNECGFRNNSDTFSIEGVLSSLDGTITLSEKLNGYLNPVPAHAVSSLPKKANKHKTRAVIIVLVIICAAIVGMTIYSNLSGKTDFMSWLVTSANKSESFDDSTPTAEEAEVNEISVDEKAADKNVEGTLKEQQPAVINNAENKTEDVTAAADASKDMFYIVAGTFKNKENAEKFNERLKGDYCKSTIRKFGSRHFVTVDEFTDLNEARRANNKYYRALQSWVLHTKNGKIIE